MSFPRTIIISNNTLAERGINHLLHILHPNPPHESYSQLQQIPNVQDSGSTILLICQDSFNDSLRVKLEKLYRQNCNLQFVAISPRPIPDSLKVLISLHINPSDSENTILEQLREVYEVHEDNTDKTHEGGILSERETEILRTVALGLTNKEISDTLHISTHTVITHRKNITAKLGIKTIAGLAVYAVLNGIITADEMEHGAG